MNVLRSCQSVGDHVEEDARAQLDTFRIGFDHDA